MTVLLKPIVLDSNLIVSAILNPEGIATLALEIAVENFEIVITRETILELAEVLSRNKFDRYVPIEVRQALLKQYAESAKEVAVLVEVTDCKDPKDNKFLSLALASHAKLIVSGDKRDLLCMNPYRGVDIIGLRAFVESFQKYV